jgi:23S rRNA (uracil1939-C5)-methyltransferase
VNSKANDTLYDTDIKLYKGRDYILEEMEGWNLALMPNHFTKPTLIKRMNYIKSLEILLDWGNEIVYDLYTGTGTIAQFVSKKQKK